MLAVAAVIRNEWCCYAATLADLEIQQLSGGDLQYSSM
jgi:hypothetical protein